MRFFGATLCVCVFIRMCALCLHKVWKYVLMKKEIVCVRSCCCCLDALFVLSHRSSMLPSPSWPFNVNWLFKDAMLYQSKEAAGMQPKCCREWRKQFRGGVNPPWVTSQTYDLLMKLLFLAATFTLFCFEFNPHWTPIWSSFRSHPSCPSFTKI